MRPSSDTGIFVENWSMAPTSSSGILKRASRVCRNHPLSLSGTCSKMHSIINFIKCGATELVNHFWVKSAPASPAHRTYIQHVFAMSPAFENKNSGKNLSVQEHGELYLT